VHYDVVEQNHSESREIEKIPKVSDVIVTLSSPVEHDDVHEIFVELVSSASGREVSPVQTDQHFVAHDDMYSSFPIGPLIVRSILVESVTVTDVEGGSKEVATATVTQVADSDSLVSAAQEDIHSNPRIQQDMELWRRIHEYDKESAEMSFTPVL